MKARTPCACRKCAPGIYPPESLGPVQGEGHVTSRFGRTLEHLYTSVSLDGDTLDLCVEAWAPITGDGWVIEARRVTPTQLCEHLCGATGQQEMCEQVRYGRVTIQRTLTEQVHTTTGEQAS